RAPRLRRGTLGRDDSIPGNPYPLIAIPGARPSLTQDAMTVFESLARTARTRPVAPGRPRLRPFFRKDFSLCERDLVLLLHGQGFRRLANPDIVVMIDHRARHQHVRNPSRFQFKSVVIVAVPKPGGRCTH